MGLRKLERERERESKLRVGGWVDIIVDARS